MLDIPGRHLLNDDSEKLNHLIRGLRGLMKEYQEAEKDCASYPDDDDLDAKCNEAIEAIGEIYHEVINDLRALLNSVS